MSRSDPTPTEVRAVLDAPLPTSGIDLTRRRFLQLAAAGGLGVTVSGAVPGWFEDLAAAATPLGSTEGVLVLVTLDGGNDPLDTVVPYASGAYRDARGGLALGPEAVLALDGARGLHGNLRHLRARWDLGEVAVIDGVGNPKVDLSHFSAMADLMHGGPAAGVPTTGWIGRYLDGLGGDPMRGVAIGNRAPLALRGRTTSGTTLPHSVDFVRRRNPEAESVFAGFAAMGRTATGLGPLGDQLASVGAGMMDASASLRPLYGAADGGKLAPQLRLAAGLVNADLGIRVLHATLGGFDSHAGQRAMHGARMAELDEGLRAFHEALGPAWQSRTLVVCVSEFGRRVRANGSAGTDHGAGGLVLAVGRGVRGGFHGALPSLTDLTREGNLKHGIDYRSVLGTIAGRWLGADLGALLGVGPTDLGFLGSPGGAAPGPSAGGWRPEHGDVLRLYRAFFAREPDASGARYWVGTFDRGHSLDAIAESFTQSAEFRQAYGGTSNADYVARVYRNVLGRGADQAGHRYWLGLLDGGRLTRGTLVRWVAANAEFVARHPYHRLP